MSAALSVAVFHDFSEDINHNARAPFYLPHLIVDVFDKPHLFFVKLNGVGNPAINHFYVERAGNIVCRAKVVCTPRRIVRLVVRYDYYGRALDKPS